MSLLDEIIAGATDDAVSTANLLRMVIVVCHRLDAHDVRQWANHELNGYNDAGIALPPYRGPLPASVRGRYSGPAGSSTTQTLSGSNAPASFDPFFVVSLHQPLVELEQAAAADEDPVIPWPGEAIVHWNHLEAEGTVPHISYMNLFSASTVVSRMMVRGVIDRIRNDALAFALDLQRDFPNAGEPDGPTVNDPGVQQVIHTITNNIFGDGTSVAVGPGSVQTTIVDKGDLIGFLQAVRELGVDGDALSELASIMSSSDEPEVKHSKVRALAEGVRSGSVVLATEVASTLAADGIINAASQFFG